MSADIEAVASAYGAFYESITRESVVDLRALVAPEVRFKDPFNDLHGVDSMVRVMEHMFDDATDIRFVIDDRTVRGSLCYLRWRFWFRPRRFSHGEPWQVEGVSLVRFDADGKVLEHIDYWDAAQQIYERIPVVGVLVRRLRAYLALSS
ncbi:MAG: nuclear transport factor 2 family protein [Pseudomonadota bacterium]